MYFQSSHRAQTSVTFTCARSGASTSSRERERESARKGAKAHFWYKKCTKGGLFAQRLVLFMKSAETPLSRRLMVCCLGSVAPLENTQLRKERTNEHKEFTGGRPLVCVPSVRWTCPICPVICPVCPADFLPLKCEFPHESAQTSRVSLAHPEFIPGTLPGHSDHQIPLCDFSLSVFFSITFVGCLLAHRLDP